MSQVTKVRKVRLDVEAYVPYDIGGDGIMERALLKAREHAWRILKQYDGKQYPSFEDALHEARMVRARVLNSFRWFANEMAEDWYHNPIPVITSYEGFVSEGLDYDTGVILAGVMNGIQMYMLSAGLIINGDNSLEPWAEFAWVLATKPKNDLEIIRLKNLRTDLERLVKKIAERLYLDVLTKFSVYVRLA
jgi:hypothetical protein